jgi:hypothetical protein
MYGKAAVALWLLAASLVKHRRLDDATEAMRNVLDIEPQLMVRKLRERTMGIGAANRARGWLRAKGTRWVRGHPVGQLVTVRREGRRLVSTVALLP